MSRGLGTGWIAALAALVVVVCGFLMLPSYGLTWDEAAVDVCWGQRYFGFYRSGDARWLDPRTPLPGPVPLPAAERAPLRAEPWVTYPVGPALGAAVGDLLSRRLRLLDPVDGLHAANVLLTAVLAAAMVLFLRPRLGAGPAVLAPALLLLEPRIVYHVAANLKDLPHAVLFALAAMAWIAAAERGSAAGTAGAGLVWGLALASRPNAAFLPAVPVVLAVTATGGRSRGRRLANVAGSLAAGVAVAVAAMPDLWAGPPGTAARRLAYVAGRSLHPGGVAEAGAGAMLLLTTPLPVLALAAVGLVPLLEGLRGRRPLAVGLAVWLAAVGSRYLLGITRNYDGIRHFLEAFPALAMVAAWGALWVWQRTGRRRVAAVVLAASVFPGAVAVVRTHPFGAAYWNGLAGGLGGARARGLPQAGEYWAASYRLGIRWLNANARPGAALVVPVAEHVVAVEGPGWLRADIELLRVSSPLGPRLDPRIVAWLGRLARRRPVYVMFVVRDDWANRLTRHCRRQLRPVAAWRLEGEPVLLVYRFPPSPRPERHQVRTAWRGGASASDQRTSGFRSTWWTAAHPRGP